ncbi:MAG: hypothetical protein ACRC35_00945 [Angustibacter sp.]
MTGPPTSPLLEAYLTWCVLHGHNPHEPGTLDAFHPQLTPARSGRAARRRYQALRAAAGRPAPAQGPPPRRTLRAGELTIDDALTALAATTGPDQARAHRDAVILTAILDLHLTKSQTRHATATPWPVPALAGTDLTPGSAPPTCRACALTRWLRTLAHARLATDDPTPAALDRHDCLHTVPHGWHAGPLLPPIDRWGQIQAHSPTPISTRTIATTLAHRLTAPPALEPPNVSGAAPTTHPAVTGGTDTSRRNLRTLTPLEAALQRRKLRLELEQLEAELRD